MTNQNDLEEEYPPEIQAVIDRFISGEIELKNKPPVDPVDRRPIPKLDTSKWHNSHESAEKALNDRKKYGSWR
jgi:hypothetical protein